MIQFLGRWLDPKHVLTISKPYFFECTIVTEVHFMFKDQPVKFHKGIKDRIFPPDNRNNNTHWAEYYDRKTIDNKLQAVEFEESEEYKSFLNTVAMSKGLKISPEMPELFESKEPKP